MYNFILQTLVMLSLGTIIYLMARAAPRVSETDLKSEPWSDYLDRLAKKIPLEKADTWASYWLERFLRQLKVLVLKLDNLLSKHLSHLRPPSQGVAKPTLFDGSTKLAINPEDTRRIEKKEENQ